MAVLSNTSRRRAHALSKLPTLGFDAAKLADFVCSGEQAREHLASRAGQRMLWIGWDEQFQAPKSHLLSLSLPLAPSPSLPLPLHTASCEQAWDPHYLDGLDLRLADAATADFVFLQGSQTLRDGSRATPTEARQLSRTHASTHRRGVEKLPGERWVQWGRESPPHESPSGISPAEVMRTGAPNDALAAALRTCAARGLPMVCANPDLSVTLPDGASGRPGSWRDIGDEPLFSIEQARAGTCRASWRAPTRRARRVSARSCGGPLHAASREQALGGSVLYYGKPHPAAFEAALASLGVPPSRVLHVGDSLLHDVAGARAAGVDSLFVAGGIHAEALGVVPDGGGGGGASPLRAAALEALFHDFGVWPTMSAPAFVWQ